MVANVCRALERSSHVPLPRSADVRRCLRCLGPWSMVRVELVPTGVACGGTGPLHIVQGALCGARGYRRGSTIRWLCDNQAAVYTVSRRSCRDQDLIRCLFFLEAWFGFEVEAVHLPCRANMLADDLSRNRLSACGPLHTGRCSFTLLQPRASGLSTQRTYRSGINRYLSFCRTFGVGVPFPVSEMSL